MLPGDFVPGGVTAYVTRVVVAGIDRPAVSATLASAMRSDLPSQISGGSTSMRRDGTIEWATQDDVRTRPVTAFRDFGVWRPQKGDSVVVYAGDGVHEWPRFVGVIDETTGSVGAGMQSTIRADLDKMSRYFSSEPLLTRMVPRSGSSTWRLGGLSPMVLVDAVLRRAGRYITPPSVDGSILNVPYQTTMRPALGSGGSLIQGGRYEGENLFQFDATASWGFSAGNFEAQYDPSRKLGLQEPLQLSVMFEPRHAGVSHITLRFGSSYVRLMITTARDVVVQAYTGGNTSEVCRLTPTDVEDADRAEILIEDGDITLRANNGANTSGGHSISGDPELTRIDVMARPDARIAGVQAYYPASVSRRWATLDREPTARILSVGDHYATWGPTQASRRFNPQTCDSVLDELAAKTLSAMWVDETGVLVFAPTGALRQKPVVQTLTTADDVLALSWSDKLLNSASEVVINYAQARLSYGMAQGIEVARGTKQTLIGDSVAEDVYKPSADEEWYGVDTSPRILPGAGWGAYNRGEGSFFGVTYMRDNDPVSDQTQYSTAFSITKTGITEWLITHETGSLPGDVVAETATHPDHGYLWGRKQGNALPVLTAWAKGVWVDHQTSASTGLAGQVLTVNMGKGAASNAATRCRNYLVNHLHNVHPQITDFPVIPDPRRQLGDHIRIRSTSFLGVTLTCLITGIDESYTTDGASQSLTLDVLDVSTGSLTYEEWEQAFPGTLTYSQWQELRDATDTYNDFNTDPLKGA